MNFFRKRKITDGEISLVKVYTFRANGKTDTPTSYVYDIVQNEDEKIVGRCDLRCGMNEELYYAGNIGYTIYVPYRGHHYAEKACRLLFAIARDKGVRELLITCSPENTASRKTCEHLDCVLVETVDVPEHHYLYQQGEPIKHIFRKDLTA